MTSRWFRRRWEEARGDQYDSWGPSTWFHEIDAEGWMVRQIEVYDNGPTLRYGPDHQEDQFGRLGEGRLDELEDWTPWTITSAEFEAAWAQDR